MRNRNINTRELILGILIIGVICMFVSGHPFGWLIGLPLLRALPDTLRED